MRALALAAALAAPAALAGQAMTTAEREGLLTSLEASGKHIVAMIEEMDAEQWSFKSAPDRWSVAEIAEHILIAERNLKMLSTERIPTSGEPVSEDVAPNAEILAFIRDRSQRFQTQEAAEPQGRWPTRSAFLVAWGAHRAALREFIESTDVDMHSRVLKAAGLERELDGQGWLVFMSGHSDRHLDQIHEVVQHASFPGGPWTRLGGN